MINKYSSEYSDKGDDITPPKGTSKKKADGSKGTPNLDKFGKDLTNMAITGSLDPVIGRVQEIKRISQILSRRKKNNPILVGEPGVGKSAIAEGLALNIVNRKVPRILFNKRIISLDLASLVAGTKYRGQFEDRMKSIIEELEESSNIILFIDEIHTMMGAGAVSGSLDAANILKPSLARGLVQCIGATTNDEYREHIEKDGALERRFQKVMIEATSIEDTIEILENTKFKYEDHHNVEYTNESIELCVTLTDRYITDRQLPDKAIDVMDEAGSKININNVEVPKKVLQIENQIETVKQKKTEVVNNQKYEQAAKLRDKERHLGEKLDVERLKWEEDLRNNRELVNAEDIYEVISSMTGIPITKISKKETYKLLDMPDKIGKRIIGQEDAVNKIIKSIQRSRMGLKDPSKPIGSFIFLGPSGVGKTQLAKEISRYIFDTEDGLIRVDMSEYMEKVAVSKLVGAPPGYVGYEEGGFLTEQVKRKPYSIILLDEIEKAHPDIFNILLQVLDDGHLTDGLGRKIDFKNTIIIMTSNVGTRKLKDFGSGVGFSTNAKLEDSKNHSEKVLTSSLKKAFTPEFLNRLDDVIIFNSLSKEDTIKIIDIEIKGLISRLKNIGYNISISKQAKEFLADKGYDPEYGARPLKRAIQKYIEDPLADEMMKMSDNINVKVGFTKAVGITVKIV